MSDETVNPLIGDPETSGQAAASSAMAPAVQAYISGTPGRVLNGLTTLTPVYDPAAGLAGNALNPAGLEAAQNLALSFAGGAIKGYHGTPHQFEPVEGNPFGEFRNEAIGSGEGAQSFGWGHYVAGNQKTAETYKRTAESFPTFEGQNFWNHELAGDYTSWNAMKAVNAYQGDVDQAIKSLNARRSIDDGSSAQWLKDNREKIGWDPAGGSLLEVHILPEEHELLDWDRPLSEQASGVQEALKKFDPSIGDYKPDTLTGEYIYRRLSQQLTHEAAQKARADGQIYIGREDEATSAALHDAGIPGIKYLDAGSRASGEGTHNYVIFDPSNLRIIARNGQRLEPVDSNPFEESK